MEGEKKRGRGWWALAGLGMFTLLVLYAGAYYSLVAEPIWWCWGEPAYHLNDGWRHDAASVAFAPMHKIDRLIRREYWDGIPLPGDPPLPGALP